MSFPSTLYASCKVPIRSSKLGENELFRYINCEEANDSESESESEKEMEEMEGARQFSAMALRRLSDSLRKEVQLTTESSLRFFLRNSEIKTKLSLLRTLNLDCFSIGASPVAFSSTTTFSGGAGLSISSALRARGLLPPRPCCPPAPGLGKVLRIFSTTSAPAFLKRWGRGKGGEASTRSLERQRRVRKGSGKMARRYDSRTTIFSPEGRLYQVSAGERPRAAPGGRPAPQPHDLSRGKKKKNGLTRSTFFSPI